MQGNMILPISRTFSLLGGLLTSAPPVIVVELLSKWLDISELCRLDSGSTNVSLRDLLMFYLSANKIRFDADRQFKQCDKYLQWLSDKRMRVKQLILGNIKTFSCGFFERCDQVYKIELINCDITNESLISLLTNAPLLKELKIDNCNQISDTAILDLSLLKEKVFCSLEILSIHSCALLSDACLVGFASLCPTLKSLSLSNCSFSQKGIMLMLQSCGASLLYFSCERCVDVSGIGAILRAMTALTADDKLLPLVREVSVDHVGGLCIKTAVSNVHQWIPHISALEAMGSLRLRVNEDTDDLVLSVNFTRHPTTIISRP